MFLQVVHALWLQPAWSPGAGAFFALHRRHVCGITKYVTKTRVPKGSGLFYDRLDEVMSSLNGPDDDDDADGSE